MNINQVSIDSIEILSKVLLESELLLLDFDGPICSIFSNHPAPVAARKLRHELAQFQHRPLPSSLEHADDPFEVLRYAGRLGHAEARHIEKSLRDYESEAASTARPTPAAHNFIHAWHDTGRALAIVSNNSKAAIEVYPARHGLAQSIEFVSARNEADPDLLKPNPHLLIKALEFFPFNSSAATLTGDSLTDIQAAHEVGTKSIWLANNARKIDPMKSLIPTALISSMDQILKSLPTH